MKSGRSAHTGMLLLTATIWGFAFVAQSMGMDHVGPFTFTALRSVIGGLVLLPVIIWLSPPAQNTPPKRSVWRGGILCGMLLFVAASLQQIGIQYTTVGKAGFITTFYIILVPLLSLRSGRKFHPFMWPTVMVALLGLYLLSINEAMHLEKGDAYILACSFVFALHIMVIDHFSPYVDGVRMSCIQFFVCGVLASLPMFLLESPQMVSIQAAWAPILYAGILSNGVAYTLQILGQKGVHPTLASLILSLESCIAVLGGWLFLREVLTSRELLGCALLFAAIIAAQLLPQQTVATEAANKEATDP